MSTVQGNEFSMIVTSDICEPVPLNDKDYNLVFRYTLPEPLHLGQASQWYVAVKTFDIFAQNWLFQLPVGDVHFFTINKRTGRPSVRLSRKYHDIYIRTGRELGNALLERLPERAIEKLEFSEGKVTLQTGRYGLVITRRLAMLLGLVDKTVKETAATVTFMPNSEYVSIFTPQLPPQWIRLECDLLTPTTWGVNGPTQSLLNLYLHGDFDLDAEGFKKRDIDHLHFIPVRHDTISQILLSFKYFDGNYLQCDTPQAVFALELVFKRRISLNFN